jgi:hypothetical protein
MLWLLCARIVNRILIFFVKSGFASHFSQVVLGVI